MDNNFSYCHFEEKWRPLRDFDLYSSIYSKKDGKYLDGPVISYKDRLNPKWNNLKIIIECVCRECKTKGKSLCNKYI